VLFDHSGNYTSAILVAAGIGFLALPLALWLPRHTRAVVAPARVASAA
jgi:hypothetical protein